jgi:hypothetical protein
MKTLSFFAMATALLGSGCFFESDDDFRARGTLVVDWTVDGVKDPAECVQGGADRIDIVLHTRGGSIVSDFQEFCEVFATSISLPAGAYTLDAALIDLDGFERTTAVSDSFLIFERETTVSAIDFPADSFF